MENKILHQRRKVYSVAYAKINLILNVESKLESGFNKIRTLFSEIDLYDSLKYSLTKKSSIEVWSDREELCGRENLIYKVAEYLKNRYCVKSGVYIELYKRIPLAAGLGGGSSDAANAIKSLNLLWDLNLSKAELHDVAARFGSDINFFLEGGTACGFNRGEVIERVEDVNIKNILLVNPNIGISSGEAYSLIKDRRKNKNFESYLQTGDIHYLFNDLQGGIFKKYPLVEDIVEELTKLGAEFAQMSGSGSTCYGIFSTREILEEAESFFRSRGYWVNITKTI